MEEKVASSDAFAEKVGAEKVKVNAENEAAAQASTLTSMITKVIGADPRE